MEPGGSGYFTAKIERLSYSQDYYFFAYLTVLFYVYYAYK